MTADVPAPADAWVHAEAVIRDPTGLHARPAVKLTKLAKRFAARVELRAEGATDWANAKSPNAVMKLKAGHATRLGIRAAGDDAGAAAEALRALVDANFNEPSGT